MNTFTQRLGTRFTVAIAAAVTLLGLAAAPARAAESAPVLTSASTTTTALSRIGGSKETAFLACRYYC